MKRFLIVPALLLVAGLVGCTLPVPRQTTPTDTVVTPTLSDDQMQTQIVELLTQMPTSTGLPEEPTATPALATLTPEGMAATELPTAELSTATLEAPTATLAPTTVVETPIAATATPAAPTLTPTLAYTLQPGDPRAKFGQPAATDPMDDDRAWYWPTGSDQYSAASFKNGAMVLTATDPLDGWRMANPLGKAFDNLYLEGTFKTQECKGSDHYGLVLRVPQVTQPDQGYLFAVTCDGRYSLRRWDGRVGTKGEMKWLVNWTASPAITTGSNQTNRLGVLTIGTRIALYANGTLLTEVQDDRFTTGYFGVLVGQDETKDMVVLVDEMSYWLNPQP